MDYRDSAKAERPGTPAVEAPLNLLYHIIALYNSRMILDEKYLCKFRRHYELFRYLKLMQYSE